MPPETIPLTFAKKCFEEILQGRVHVYRKIQLAVYDLGNRRTLKMGLDVLKLKMELKNIVLDEFNLIMIKTSLPCHKYPVDYHQERDTDPLSGSTK